ncbi:GFA family protein [Streptomyces sp. MCAF7]
MWWVGFEAVTWTGESEPTWYETFEGEVKRAFCHHCGSRLAAIDSDIPEIGINVTALDDTSGPDLVPIHTSFRDNTVHWLPPVPEIEHSTAG